MLWKRSPEYTGVPFITGQYGERQMISPHVAMVPVIVAKLSTVYNPFIYSITHPRFKVRIVYFRLKKRKKRASNLIVKFFLQDYYMFIKCAIFLMKIVSFADLFSNR